LLKLLLTCFSETMYQPPVGEWCTVALFIHSGITFNIVRYFQRAETTLSVRYLSIINSLSVTWWAHKSWATGCPIHICGSSVWNLLHVILEVPRTLRCLLDFLRIVHLCQIIFEVIIVVNVVMI
jgi:hypothetical protein